MIKYDMDAKNSERVGSDRKQMITVWEWTGVILLIYAVVLIIAGSIYEPKIFSLNTSFLWGIFLLMFSGLLIYAGRRSRLKSMAMVMGILLFPQLSYSQTRDLEWEFLYPNPSVEGTGGLFRVVSPRALGFKNFVIGTYLGFYNTSDDMVLLISRDHFALKERKERVMFEVFDSLGIFNYIFLSFGAPALRVAGFLTGDISLAVRNSSVLITQKVRGQELIKDNVQSFGDFIITPKLSYTIEARYVSFALWNKIYLLSRYRSPSIAAVSTAPGFSFMFDPDEMSYFKRLWEDIELVNPKFYLSISFNFDNSQRAIPQNVSGLVPSFVKTAMMIEPYDQLQFGVGLELGDSRKGIGKFISGFTEWYLHYYVPPPDQATFLSMPQHMSVGIRFKPIPLISRFLLPVPREIRESSMFVVTDFNLSRVFPVLFEIGPTVYLRNSYPWAVFFGASIIWNPWERGLVLLEGGKAKIKVVDSETFLPIGDVIVSYPGFDLSNQSTDPSSGEVTTYELPPGEWELNFRKAGYESQVAKVRVEKGVIKEIEITMAKQRGFALIFGNVRSSADGSPLSARIEIEGTNLPPFFSKPQDGSYEISLSPGNYKIKVSSHGYNPAEVTVKLLAGDKKRYDIILEPVKEIIQVEREMLLKSPEKKITIEKETNTILLPEKILFDDMTNDVLQTSEEIIMELAEFIKRELPNKKIVIEVHISPMKSKEEDRVITLRRAEKIIALLEKYGVSRENLIPVGKGSDYPIFSNDTPEGRAGNRRVYFYIRD